MPQECVNGFLPETYIAQAGDTWESIAADFGVSVERLLPPNLESGPYYDVAEGYYIYIPCPEEEATVGETQPAAPPEQSEQLPEEIAHAVDELWEHIRNSEALLSMVDLSSLTPISDLLMVPGATMPTDLPKNTSTERWLRMQYPQFDYWLLGSNRSEYGAMNFTQLTHEHQDHLIGKVADLLFTDAPYLMDYLDPTYFPIETSGVFSELSLFVEYGQRPYEVLKARIWEIVEQNNLHPLQIAEFIFQLIEHNAQLIWSQMASGQDLPYDPEAELAKLSQLWAETASYVAAIEEDQLNLILETWHPEIESRQLSALLAEINLMPKGLVWGIAAGQVRYSFQAFYDFMQARHDALSEYKDAQFTIATADDQRDREIAIKYLDMIYLELGQSPPDYAGMTTQQLYELLGHYFTLQDGSFLDIRRAYEAELDALLGIDTQPLLDAFLFFLSLIPVVGAGISLLQGDIVGVFLDLIPFGDLARGVKGLATEARGILRSIPPYSRTTWSSTVEQVDEVAEGLNQRGQQLAFEGPSTRTSLPITYHMENPGQRLGNTLPSRRSDPNALPGGIRTEDFIDGRYDVNTFTYETIARVSDLGVQDHLYEDATAIWLQRQGYNVIQNPSPAQLTAVGYISKTNKTPDFIIEGRVFDQYTPRVGTSVRNMQTNVFSKAGVSQAPRIILDLSRVTLPEAQSIWTEMVSWLQANWGEVAGTRLQEVICLWTGQIIGRWLPPA